MKWFAVIKGDNFDLEELSKSLNSPGLCIIRKEEQFILKSSDFNLLNDADDVRNKANEIISQINGAAKLTLGTQKPIEVSSIHKINDDGTIHGFVTIPLSFNLRTSVSCSIVSPDGTIQKSHQCDPIPSWINIAQHDTNVAKVLRLFGSGAYDWKSLYIIYEVIESDVSRSHIINKGWATEEPIRRFKHTANSPAAIGDEARHGKNTIPPPRDPMALSEAKPLVETILRNWLRSKGGQP